MKLVTIVKLVLGFFALSLLTSCVVQDGPSGPQGPQGPQGPAGQDGVANVFSIRYDVETTDWISSGMEGQPGYFLELEINVPEIDALIAEDGLVLAYYREQAGDPWILLPYTFISGDNVPYVEVLDFIYGEGFVNFKSQADDFGATAYAGTFRILIADAIPVAKQAIDWKDFDAVAQLLDLDNAIEMTRTLDGKAFKELEEAK